MGRGVTVIGGGLAGVEAAWQAARHGVPVRLYEMRPAVMTPAHSTDRLGELVCSNSLKSDQPETAPWLLKEELRRLGSLSMRVADEARVPAGHALAVDREEFSRRLTAAVEAEPGITVVREEVRELPPPPAQASSANSAPDEAAGVTVVASGPLTSPALAASIAEFAGSENLYFYDAISPIVAASSLDTAKLSAASRYGKGGRDYLNAFLSKEEYLSFYDALIRAESAPLRDFEEPRFFEGCLPVEELARRGIDTLRFGPMKPVGLDDPRTGRRAYAAVQLRLENQMADSYNLVGFQNHLKFPEQRRVFRMIPGLEGAEFLRFGQIHRNSYIHAPRLLGTTLQAKARPDLFFAGQLCGCEGYVEAVATGLLAGANAARVARGLQPATPPEATALGSIARYLAAPQGDFQPANITFGLMTGAPAEILAIRDKKERRRAQTRHALDTLRRWMDAPP
ncbi:MAG: methylenetetrahydrofolate--tRNA-(uracil(54)-C(5))-methyltransferase (FADH(2)-oxidizing) TrmFO [Acidobacteriota bacterium]|jgi:methylenetetrahydrofolate--tRNA-(uracil-5-)-methyltransferase|nr:methylenetetrahydrofolate--tRNA-(uracil(54)-C(5))-methyltransferase (FADH(2)-oxidizing) TrmFO [Acidobacteriota bacterium]